MSRQLFSVKTQPIQVFTPSKSKKLFSLSFDLPVFSSCFGDTLMKNFQSLGLTAREKQLLTLENRKEILSYQKIKKEELYKSAVTLVKKLSTLKNEEIIIKAKQHGAYICLMAICSGKVSLNNEKHWQFRLEDLPLSLFPKELIKSSDLSSVDLSIKFSNGWLNEFKTLKQAPDHLEKSLSFGLLESNDSFHLKMAS